MPSYVFYDKTSGDILHVHREYYMSSEQTVEVDETRLMRELGELLPKDVEVQVLAVDESPQPVKGYRYYVDLRTSRLMLVEKPQVEMEQRS